MNFVKHSLQIKMYLYESHSNNYCKDFEYLKKGYTIRDVAKLCGKGVSTVQRVKKEFVGIILYWE